MSACIPTPHSFIQKKNYSTQIPQGARSCLKYFKIKPSSSTCFPRTGPDSNSFPFNGRRAGFRGSRDPPFAPQINRRQIVKRYLSGNEIISALVSYNLRSQQDWTLSERCRLSKLLEKRLAEEEAAADSGRDVHTC